MDDSDGDESAGKGGDSDSDDGFRMGD